MGFARTAFDWLVLVFFVSHIPITIFVDSQGIFPREWYPQLARDMLDNFIRDYKDPLMTAPLEPWFKALVYSEVFLQLPFFFVGAYAFAVRANWVRVPALIYGAFVSATMVPILGALAAHRAPGYTPAPVVAFYLPYLLIPAALVAVMAANPVPFQGKAGGGRRAARGKPKRG